MKALIVIALYFIHFMFVLILTYLACSDDEW